MGKPRDSTLFPVKVHWFTVKSVVQGYIKNYQRNKVPHVSLPHFSYPQSINAQLRARFVFTTPAPSVVFVKCFTEVRDAAWLGLCVILAGRGTTILPQLHNNFFALIAVAHILSCRLESAFF